MRHCTFFRVYKQKGQVWLVFSVSLSIKSRKNAVDCQKKDFINIRSRLIFNSRFQIQIEGRIGSRSILISYTPGMSQRGWGQGGGGVRPLRFSDLETCLYTRLSVLITLSSLNNVLQNH